MGILLLHNYVGSILEISGGEFFLGFSTNHQGRNHQGSIATLQLFVTTSESDPMNFVVNATGFSFSGVATPNSSTVVTLPRDNFFLTKKMRHSL